MQNFAVVGYPLTHTLSPFIHNFVFDICKTDAKYTAIEVKPENLSNDYNTILCCLDGYNVTIPHKQNIISFLSSLDERAALYKSVNTVKNTDNESVGYTTDGLGFLQSLEKNKTPLCGRVLILGCGGVARVFAFEAALRNCEVVFAVREKSLNKCSAIVSGIREKTLNQRIYFKSAEKLLTDLNKFENGFDFLINATPVGMYPHIDAQPTDDEIIKKSNFVFDAVYNPNQTLLLKKAEAFGKETLGGLGMLLYQALESQKIWGLPEISESDEKLLLKELECELKKRNG